MTDIDDAPRRMARPPLGQNRSDLPPYDGEAEAGVMGAAMLYPTVAAAVAQRPDDYYWPLHADIAAVVAHLVSTEAAVDPSTVLSEMRRRGVDVDPPDLLALQAHAPPQGAALRLLDVVADCAHRRRVGAMAVELRERAYLGQPGVAEVAAQLAELAAAPGLAALAAGEDPNAPDPDIGEFLHSDEPEHDWLIRGLIERGDRVIITGHEGSGKSTLLRQFGVMAAAGIHPFTLEQIDPIKVMFVDLENSTRQVRRKLRPLWLAARDLAPGRMRIRVVAQGIDLLREADRGFLAQRIAANEPDLVIMGPLYKLVGDDPVKEEPARVAALYLDALRTRHGFGLMMETHCPHGANGAKRPERPYGASLWMRWPEFGIYLDATPGSEALRHWRGARDEREWPTLLRRGGTWPWTPVTDARSLTFDRVVQATREAGRRLSERELARVIGGSDSQVHRAISANRAQYQEVLRGLEDEEF